MESLRKYTKQHFRFYLHITAQEIPTFREEERRRILDN